MTELNDEKVNPDEQTDADAVVISRATERVDSYKYGGGSSYTTFEGAHFKVLQWRRQNGITTEIAMRDSPYFRVSFDGRHKIASDEHCFELLRPDELAAMLDSRLEYIADQNVRIGERQARFRIRQSLGL